MVHSGGVAGQTEADGSFAALIPAPQRDAMVEYLSHVHRWGSEDYDLELLPDWNHHTLPVAIAVARTPTSVAPVFAVLPDGYVVSPHDPDGLRQIVAQVFPLPRAVQARLLAKISIFFGQWKDSPGRLVESPSSDNPQDLPRADFSVQYVEEEGAHRIRFYSYDGVAERLYDCELRIADGTPLVTSRWIVDDRD